MRTFPDFQNKSLADIAASLKRRSKAITYNAPGWTVSREIESDGSERLNADAEGHHGQLRLSVWEGGPMWFRLCRGRAKNGWDFMLAFHGDTFGVAPNEIAQRFISSISTLTTSTDYLALWDIVSPTVERSESKV